MPFLLINLRITSLRLRTYLTLISVTSDVVIRTVVSTSPGSLRTTSILRMLLSKLSSRATTTTLSILSTL